jgi:hypothetical protein
VTFRYEHIPYELKTKILRLRSNIAGDKFLLAVYEYQATQLERRYSPDQPRVPAGSSEGGQWTSVGATAAARVRAALKRGVTRVSDIVSDLEELGGGKPVLRPSPKGASQFIFPNGMILRFDLSPAQHRGSGPHINLHYGDENHHIYLK